MPNGYYNQHYGVNRYVSGKQITNDDKKTKMKEAELDRRKFITLGLSGLMNMGNTCYFNSVIQLLSNCPLLFAKFKDPSIIDNIVRKNIYDNIQKIKDDNILLDEDSKLEIDKEKFKNEIEDTLTFQLHKVVKTMWEKNHLVRPRSLKETIAKHPTLAGYGQQDAQEALQFILDHIHDETSYNVKDTQFKEEIVAKILPNIEKVKECSKIIDESKNIDDKKLASDTLMNMYNSDPDTYLMMMAVVQWKSFLAREGESDFTHLIWGQSSRKDILQLRGQTEDFVKPIVGTMLVFPNWLKHQVMPFFGDGERRSMAMNWNIRDSDQELMKHMSAREKENFEKAKAEKEASS